MNEMNEWVNEWIYDMSQRRTTTMMFVANNVSMMCSPLLYNGLKRQASCYYRGSPYKTRRCNPRTADWNGKHLARCSWANHVRRRILPFLAIDRIKFTIQALIGAVKLSDPVASPFHADRPPVGFSSVPGSWSPSSVARGYRSPEANTHATGYILFIHFTHWFMFSFI